MAKQLYSEFADLVALEAEKDRVLGIFKEVSTGITKLSDLGFKINTSSSVKGVTSLTEAFDQQNDTLNKQQKQLVIMAEKLAALTTNEAKQIETVKQITTLTKQLTSEEVKLDLSRQKEFVTLVQSRIVNKQLNADIQLRQKIQAASEGSQVKLNLLNEKAVRIINRLSAAQRETPRGQGLIKYANDLTKQLKVIEQQTGNFRRNVGNYANSLADGFKLVANEIAALRVKQAGLIKEQERAQVEGFVFGNKKDLDETTSALNTLTTAEAKASAEGATLDKQSRVLANTYKVLASNGSVSREFIKGFRVAAAQAKDTVGDLNDELNALSSDTRKLDLVVGAISSIASAAELGASAYSLFGGETEDAQRALAKLVAVQGVANSVRQLGTDLTTKGTAANKAYTVVQEQMKILFDKNSTAAQRFSVILKSIGVLALIAGLVALVTYLTKTSDSADKAEKAMSDLNDELERNAKINARTDSQRSFASNAAILDLQKRIILEENKLKAQLRNAKTDEEREAIQARINKLKKEGRTEEINLENDALSAELQRTYDRKEQAAKDLRQLEEERDNAIKAQQAKEATLTPDQRAKRKVGQLLTGDADEETIKGFDERIKVRKEKLEEFSDLYQNQSQDLVLALKRGNNEILADDEDTGKKRSETAKKSKIDILKEEYELYVQRKTFQKEFNDLLLNEDSDAPANFQIEASKKSAALAKDIILATRDYELKQEGIGEKAKQKIRENSLKLYFDETQNNIDRILKIRIAAINKERAAAEASAAEFDEREYARAQARAERDEKNLGNTDLKAQRERDERIVSLNERYAAELEAADGNEKKIEAATRYYAEKKEKIELDYQRAVLDSQIIFYEKQLELLATGSDEYIAMAAKLAAARKQQSELSIQADSDEIKSKEALKQAYKDLFETVQTTGFEIFSNIFDQQSAKIEQAINDIDRLSAKEKERVDNSTDSEEKKAAKIALINDRAQRQREVLERRQRQVERQKAIFQRAQQAFEIAISTAKTVAIITQNAAIAGSAPLTPVPIQIANKARILAQIPFTIAAGAISLAALLSQPLPSFYTGTDNAPEGPANLAERGPELSVDKRGKLRYWEKPTIGYLTSGERVFPAHVTAEILNSVSGLPSMPTSPTVIVTPSPSREDEVIDWLRQIAAKQGIIINNSPGIETSANYIKLMKR